MNSTADVSAVAASILADSAPLAAYQARCRRTGHALQQTISILERCRKVWPVEDTGTHGLDHLDRAMEEIEKAIDIVRAEAFPAPKGV